MTKTRRRMPLWATVIPLVAGVVAYYTWWDSQREQFAKDLTRVLGSGVPVTVSGFPYRLEADLGQVALSRITPMVTLRVAAEGFNVNRAPIGRPLTVVSTLKPVMSAQLAGIEAAKLDISAANSRSSLRFDKNGHIARLSNAFQQATVRIPAFAAPATAKSFEVHLRETPQALDPASKSPAYPEQAELVFQGDEVRYASGDPVKLSADFGLDAMAPLGGDRKVLEGATLELKKAEIADKHGLVATFNATASPGAEGNVAVAGTVDTVCPANVLALLNGTAGGKEFRTRKSVKIAYSGGVGAVMPQGAAPTDVPVRSQEPPCPVLRR